MTAVPLTNVLRHATSSSTATNELRDIRPPLLIPTGWEWLWWALGALVLAALAFAIWRWWKRRQALRPSSPPVPAHVRARQKLMDALSLIGDPKMFCIVVSDTIRGYLEERFNFHAPERTTEEFLRELSDTPLLDPTQKESLAVFLERCDLVKFAKYEPAEPELRDLHVSALRLVDETTPAPEAATANGSPPAPEPALANPPAGQKVT